MADPIRRPFSVGPVLPSVATSRPTGKKPDLTGRALALTRGKGEKVGLKRQMAGKITLPVGKPLPPTSITDRPGPAAGSITDSPAGVWYPMRRPTR